jgi:hypothetical protein
MRESRFVPSAIAPSVALCTLSSLLLIRLHHDLIDNSAIAPPNSLQRKKLPKRSPEPFHFLLGYHGLAGNAAHRAPG